MQDQDLIELQTQLAFQEHTINELNSVVIKQQQQLDRVRLELKLLTERIELLHDRVEQGGSAQHEKPPHY